MKIDTAEIKARVSLYEEMRRDGIVFISESNSLKCLCPFHKEKTPSCHVYPDHHFYCFGCHQSGDVIGYTMKFHNLTFKAAIEKLSGKTQAWVSGIDWTRRQPTAHRETPPLAGAVEMMALWWKNTLQSTTENFSKMLGVSKSSLDQIGVAWADRHIAWAFPMRDANGNMVGIRLRNPEGRKWAVPGSKEGLFYGYTFMGGTLWVCEGPTDCASGLTLGLNIVGRPSCQGAIKELVKFVEMRQCKEVIIISDNDAPGLAGSDRLEQHLPCPYRELVLPCKDLREFLKLGGTKQLLESMASKQIPRRKPKK